jgi:hypothetical protein
MPKSNWDPKLTAIQAAPDGTIEAVAYHGRTYRVPRGEGNVTLRNIRGDEFKPKREPVSESDFGLAELKPKD